MKNDYYVYLHKTLDGKPFYVGKGRLLRAWSKYSRSKLWKDVSQQGYIVEIYKDGLSNQDALILENQLIDRFTDIVNRSTQKRIDTIPMGEYFAVDTNSPSGVSRIKQSWTGVYFSGKLGPTGRKKIEDGVCTGWVICYKNRAIPAHRFIWEMTYGVIPDGYVVDHIDGNPLNNDILNLRAVTVSENTRNRKKHCKNSSGVTGVSFKANGFEARVVINDKSIFKRYGCRKYGYEEAFRLACEWRSEQIRLLNEQGAGYTERHGT